MIHIYRNILQKAYRRRAFVRKFTGSAGTAVILKDDVVFPAPESDSDDEGDSSDKVEYKKALLWSDSRYFNEAGMQLDSDHWTLMKQGQKGVPTLISFLTSLAKAKKKNEDSSEFRIGIDGFVHSASFCKSLEESIKSENAVITTLDENDVSSNIVDEIWGKERPALPSSAFRVHPLKYAGISVSDKLSKVRKEMKKAECSLSVFSTLDDVAYLMNVRASDVDCCPVGIAYCTVSNESATLYRDDVKVENNEVREHLKEAGVVIAPYENLLNDLKEFLASNEEKGKVWIDTKQSNYAISSIIPKDVLHDKQNPVTPMKASKNDEEMEGMRQAHIVDGVAMAEFMSWLEDEIVNKGRQISEVELDLVLCAARARQPGYIEPSFPTIAGVGSNGAIIHYRAKEGDLLKYLGTEEPILIDSGGQYEYGTTDETRTWHMGEATDEFKDTYTRVLKGNIGVDAMTWPENTPGFVLDVFARKALWEIGKDYGHGTGHGVGAALNVHEGPHSISPRFGSNEPGYYEDGRFGIRIENLLEVQSVESGETKTGDKSFMKFEKLTLIPIQKNLIKIDLMTDEELKWLNDYHATVLKKVGSLMEDGTPGKLWLEKMCSPMERTS